MDAQKTNALILLRKPLRESYGSITAFTKAFGKMHLTAMGLYKPSAKLSSALLPGNLVYLTLSKGVRWHITGAKTIESFAKKLFEPRLLYLSSIVRELLLELFPDEEAHDDIFNKAVECFELLASAKHSVVTKELIVYRFVLSVFDSQGLLPDFSRCARERRILAEDEQRYWKKEIGILCRQCATKDGKGSLPLPESIAAVSTYTTKNHLSKKERESITTMVQDIYQNDHNANLQSLTVWQKSM